MDNFIQEEIQGDDEPSPLISTDELLEIVDLPSTKILDCSVPFGRSKSDCCRLNFLKLHIKHAQFLDLEFLVDQGSDMSYMLPPER